MYLSSIRIGRFVFKYALQWFKDLGTSHICCHTFLQRQSFFQSTLSIRLAPTCTHDSKKREDLLFTKML